MGFRKHGYGVGGGSQYSLTTINYYVLYQQYQLTSHINLCCYFLKQTVLTFYCRNNSNLMEEEEEDYQCHVCHVPLDQKRVHYGGVSCFSCRQFFRRNAQKTRIKKCKISGHCDISHTQTPKICLPCRYYKCLK